MRALPFTFGIPLIARAAAADWALVEALLDLTLASLAGQTDGDFQVVIAGHDRPQVLMPYHFVEADWPVEPVRSDNRDSGRKKWAINAHVLHSGGGLLMLLDADDWVDAGLVAAARASIGPDDVGGLVERGFAVDLRTGCAAQIPHSAVFEGGFHGLCGSSTVAHLRPEHSDPFRRDPSSLMHEHYRWRELAREHDVALASLPVIGGYVVNTSVNHSETKGPFAEWRRTFLESVNREGRAIDAAFLARFGLNEQAVTAMRHRFYPNAVPAEIAGGKLP